MLLLSPSTIAPFGTGMKAPACAVADAAVSSNPANPIATKVFDMAYVLPGFRLLARRYDHPSRDQTPLTVILGQTIADDETPHPMAEYR